MNTERQIFLKKIVYLCLSISGMAILLYQSVLKGYYLSIFPLQFAVVILVTVISHLRLMTSVEQNAQRFITTFLSVMSAKLFIYLFFILICLLVDRSNAINFVVTFLLLYLIFTIFEVIEISNFFKKNQNSSN